VDDVFLAGLERDLMDEAFAGEGDQAAAGEAGVAPVSDALVICMSELCSNAQVEMARLAYHGGVEAWREVERVSCPR
jgi:hypothetical protein